MNVNLILFKKDGSRKTFPLSSSVTVIGRRRDCDLCIPLMSVSRRHCQLNQDGGALKIRDLGSRNGTYLNGKRIDETVIQAGDSIEIGTLAFVLQIDGRPENIGMPDLAMRKSLRESTSADDSAPEDVETFADLDDLDSLEEADSI